MEQQKAMSLLALKVRVNRAMSRKRSGDEKKEALRIASEFELILSEVEILDDEFQIEFLSLEEFNLKRKGGSLILDEETTKIFIRQSKCYIYSKHWKA